jgi:hydrogenase nickel incorporation protein HypA/HybF
MHELSVTESLLEIALRHAPKDSPTRITGLHIVIGQLASIVDDSVQFYWDIIAQGTVAEGARLEFRRIPGELLCQDCNNRFLLSKTELYCPACGSQRFKVVAGEEFYLESIDVETGSGVLSPSAGD